MRSISLMMSIPPPTTGFTAFPEAALAFLSKHERYNFGTNFTSDVPCQRYHADVYAELDFSDLHIRRADSARACISDCKICHNPIVFGANLPPPLNTTVHVARRVSCYDCHTDDYLFNVFDKTSGTNVSTSGLWSTAMDNLDTFIKNNLPLSVQGDTCISCKRAGALTPPAGPFVSYTEPSNVIYNNGNEV